MTLPTGYKFIFVDWSKETPVYVRKDDGTDEVVISYNNAGEYVDVKTFKFIYSDGTHLFGRPATGDDVNLVLKAGSTIILGELIGPVITSTPRRSRKTTVAPVEE